MKVQLDCKEVSRLISQGLDEQLPAPERARMRLHFVICETCRNVNEQMQFIRRAMKQIDRVESPSQPPVEPPVQPPVQPPPPK